MNGVDLNVESGEVVGLLGPNGAGKSTTFRLLAGLERLDAGRVEIGGVDVSRWPLHRRTRAGLAYLPQNPSVIPGLTARDNIVMTLMGMGRSPSLADPLLVDAGLGDLAHRAAATLSGGERRRLEIVRCLAVNPKVVLLDEPFAGVDPAHVRALQSAIRELAKRGLGVLLTDHAVLEAMRTIDRAYLIDQGVVQVSGVPGEVAADPRARERYLGVDFALDRKQPALQSSKVAYNEHDISKVR